MCVCVCVCVCMCVCVCERVCIGEKCVCMLAVGHGKAGQGRLGKERTYLEILQLAAEVGHWPLSTEQRLLRLLLLLRSLRWTGACRG